MPESLLLVSDEPTVLHSLYRILKRDGLDVVCAQGAEEALRALAVEPVAVCVAEMRLRGMGRLEFLARARAARSRAELVLLADTADLETVVEAMRSGASDVVAGTLSKARLEAVVAAAFERQRARHGPAQAAAPAGLQLLGTSAAIRDVFQMIERVGPSAATILVHGESGTGKELVATAIQQRSPRRQAPFVKVNCAAIPDTLMESELFGYEKGAFTGAVRSKKGRFELADGGTIFLDEIGDMSPSTQMKVLRVLQEGEFDRVGGTRTERVDVRVIAATNVDLKRAVAERRFREDLYYRLRVIEIRLPPLRERREDIPQLVEHFIGKYADRNGRNVRGIEPEALDSLLEHDWPGNVRELENAVERAVVLSRGDRLQRTDFGRDLPQRATQLVIGFPVGTRLDEIERRMIAETLRHTNGDKRRAAALLGITSRTIYRRLERRRQELGTGDALPEPAAPPSAPESPADASLAATLSDPAPETGWTPPN